MIDAHMNTTEMDDTAMDDPKMDSGAESCSDDNEQADLDPVATCARAIMRRSRGPALLAFMEARLTAGLSYLTPSLGRTSSASNAQPDILVSDPSKSNELQDKRAEPAFTAAQAFRSSLDTDSSNTIFVANTCDSHTQALVLRVKYPPAGVLQILNALDTPPTNDELLNLAFHTSRWFSWLPLKRTYLHAVVPDQFTKAGVMRKDSVLRQYTPSQLCMHPRYYAWLCGDRFTDEFHDPIPSHFDEAEWARREPFLGKHFSKEL